MNQKDNDLGRAMYKSRFGKGGRAKQTEIRKPMKSLLEESELQKIFSMGELTNKDFTAIRVINNLDREGILDEKDIEVFEAAKKEYASMLAIPRRPKGAKNMTKEDLLSAEKESFVMWRRQLSEIEKDQRVKMTPYEMNLDFWRQLWRVIERSDVLVQVVDARNPLLFRNEDLESYVKEVDENKINILLINKSDFLTEKQRIIWAKYFDDVGLRVIFWSAKLAEGTITKTLINENFEDISKEYEKEDEENSDEEDESTSFEDESNSHEEDEEKLVEEDEENSVEEDEDISEINKINKCNLSCDINGIEEDCHKVNDPMSKDLLSICGESESTKNSHHLVGVNALISLLEAINVPKPYEEGKITVGLVGYPNVGKSSSINAIYGSKKLSVSATPGHTKRFQTLNITDKLTFCDCPGLVMPSIVHSRGHLMVSGILPIDTIRDYIAPINIIADQFPRQLMEIMYGITLPDVLEGDNPNRAPTARELLSSYSYMHGMMTSKGNPNLDRAARIILKDYVDGRLLYRHPPPNVNDVDFEAAADLSEEKKNKPRPKPPCTIKRREVKVEVPMDDVLNKLSKGFIVKEFSINKKNKLVPVPSDVANTDKPWRLINKRGKKLKSRIVNKQLDQHEYIYQ